MLSGVVESISLVKHIGNNLDLCKIQIGFDDLFIFFAFNDLGEFVNKPVQYDVRQDVYEGKPITVVANIANEYTIQTLDKVTGIRLIPEDAEVRIGCNFSISSLKPGCTEYGCIAFLSDYEVGSSSKTTWIDCKMVDASAKVFTLRIFTRDIESDIDAVDLIKAKVGKYIKFDITSTRYGYQTNEIEICSVPVVTPPEVDTAIAIIKEAVKDDAELQSYITDYEYIERLKSVIECEPGYALVAVASEITMINALQNISNFYDTRLMIRAAVTSRGYLLPSKTKFSRPVLNTNKILRSKLSSCRDLLLILDPLADEESSATKSMYMKVAAFVKQVIDERRGLVENNEFIKRDELRAISGGLL